MRRRSATQRSHLMCSFVFYLLFCLCDEKSPISCGCIVGTECCNSCAQRAGCTGLMPGCQASSFISCGRTITSNNVIVASFKVISLIFMLRNQRQRKPRWTPHAWLWSPCRTAYQCENACSCRLCDSSAFILFVVLLV